MQRGEQAGFPRCQGSERYHSFTYTEDSNGARLENGFLVLAKIGRRAVRGSRALGGTPKTVTVTHEAAGWYVTFSCAEVPIKALPLSDEETGIDRGVESFATLADGSPIATPRSLRVAARTRKRAQRRVSRRQHGSRRRRKAVRLLARAHQRARRARADVHHQMALALVRQYDTISHAALQPANMVKNHSLAKRIGAAGWSGFLSILSCQAGAAGKTVIAVPAPFTAHAWSGCGVIVQKALSVRWHLCPVGGMSLQRDHNAAITILRLGPGQSGLGQSPQASPWPGGARVA